MKVSFCRIAKFPISFFISPQFNAYFLTYLLPMGGSYLRKQTGNLASARRLYNPQFPKPAFPWNSAKARWQQLKLNSTITRWQQLKLSTSKVATIETCRQTKVDFLIPAQNWAQYLGVAAINKLTQSSSCLDVWLNSPNICEATSAFPFHKLEAGCIAYISF